MLRVRSRKAYQHVSDFDKGQIVAYRNCGLSYHCIAARFVRDLMTVSRIWNRQKVSARTVRRRLQQHGLSAWRPWLRLPLTLHYRKDRLQWCEQRKTWVYEWRYVIFSDESRFCLQHQDGHSRVWRHRGEHTLAACIRHRHSGPSPSVIMWDAIGYTSQPPHVPIDSILNSTSYISVRLNSWDTQLVGPYDSRYVRLKTNLGITVVTVGSLVTPLPCETEHCLVEKWLLGAVA
ncbi:transposable element Tcb1 transposase [Trichonephila clavipes]|nr:transposable element Tcb1 transposase [Trichonephila clavipes]